VRNEAHVQRYDDVREEDGTWEEGRKRKGHKKR
jgi:hypothetical protein